MERSVKECSSEYDSTQLNTPSPTRQGKILRTSTELSVADNETLPALTPLSFPFEIQTFYEFIKENKLPIVFTVNATYNYYTIGDSSASNINLVTADNVVSTSGHQNQSNKSK